MLLERPLQPTDRYEMVEHADLSRAKAAPLKRDLGCRGLMLRRGRYFRNTRSGSLRAGSDIALHTTRAAGRGVRALTDVDGLRPSRKGRRLTSDSCLGLLRPDEHLALGFTTRRRKNGVNRIHIGVEIGHEF